MNGIGTSPRLARTGRALLVSLSLAAPLWTARAQAPSMAPATRSAPARMKSAPQPNTTPAAVTVPDTSEITEPMVQAGRAVFHGAGQCFVCHGANLEGVVGPTLRAHAWKDAGKGELPSIYRVITHGVPGTMMVSHPGGISDEAAVSVAVYVWSVSHGKAKP